jgi:hypothetical protein
MEMNTFYVLFAAAIIASAKSPEMKASFNNNLPNQTKGVMVNPENPDSKAIIQENIKMKITNITADAMIAATKCYDTDTHSLYPQN